MKNQIKRLKKNLRNQKKIRFTKDCKNFKAEKPSEKWVGDITYIYTKETGWTYLAIVIDLFDLKVIGWSYGVNMTANLVINAFAKAKSKRDITENMIFHSDLGLYLSLLKVGIIIQESMAVLITKHPIKISSACL